MNNTITMRDTIYSEGLNDLINYINEFKDTTKLTMIEIGSYKGESTEIFLKRFKHVISIDPYINDYDINDPACFSNYKKISEIYFEFFENVSKYGNLKHIKKTSDDAFLSLNNIKVDFVYIDGLHTYEQVKKDINNYKNIINFEGFIGGHDYHNNWKPVIKAIHEELGEPDKIFKDTSWIKKL